LKLIDDLRAANVQRQQDKLKSYHIEFISGLTCVVKADNIYSVIVKASDLHRLSTEDIVGVCLMRGGD
jgi:hypothetical protein